MPGIPIYYYLILVYGKKTPVLLFRAQPPSCMPQLKSVISIPLKLFEDSQDTDMFDALFIVNDLNY